jgi:hypothetical protein
VSPPTGPVSFATGGASSDPDVAFDANADAICSHFKPKLENDLASRRSNAGSPALLQDTKSLVNDLTHIGVPTTGASVWQLGLEDWTQAAAFLIETGDPQDWQINIAAGAQEFGDLGIQACGSYASFGQ